MGVTILYYLLKIFCKWSGYFGIEEKQNFFLFLIFCMANYDFPIRLYFFYSNSNLVNFITKGIKCFCLLRGWLDSSDIMIKSEANKKYWEFHITVQSPFLKPYRIIGSRRIKPLHNFITNRPKLSYFKQ